MADQDRDDVFFSIGLQPHHDDQPFAQNMHHDVHRERHRNTQDYVAEHRSPNTNRSYKIVLCIKSLILYKQEECWDSPASFE